MMYTNEPDLGPLTWVKSEIDQALSHAADSLQAALGSTDGSAKVQFAQNHLHQAGGALSIIGLDGLTKFISALDLFLAALARGELKLDEAQVTLARRGLDSIANYLEELVHGAPDQPLRLLPLYQELVLARGETASSPADLFFPDLSVRLPPREETSKLDAAQRQQQRRSMRLRFQRGLLDWLRQPGAAGIDAMRAALAGLEVTEDGYSGMRSLWWAGQAFVDTFSTLSPDEQSSIKHLLTRIESQLHRIEDTSQALPERLLRELLYHIASHPASTQIQQATRRVWQLDALIPEQDSVVSDQPLGPLLQELRPQFTRIKDEWSVFGERGATALPQFEAQLKTLTNSTAPLGRPVLYRLLSGMCRFIAWLNANPQRYSEPIALEFATALLLAEAALDCGLPDPGFQTQVGDALSRLEALARGEELGATPSATSVESARKQQEREAVAQLSREILSSLATIEQTLDDFFRDHSKRAPLETLHTPLHQIEGALSLLGESDAISLIHEAGEAITHLAKQDTPVDDAELTELARRFSALGFFVQSLPYNRTSITHFLRPITTSVHPKYASIDLPELPDIPEILVSAEPQARAPSGPADGIETFPVFEVETEETAGVGTPPPSPGKPTPKPAPFAVESRSPAIESRLPATGSRSPAIGIGSSSPATESRTPSATQTQTPLPDIDVEVLAIFIEEAHEILKSVIDHLGLLHASPSDLDYLTVIRRGFHTLKGSGRMAGLIHLGDAAWGVEKTLNRWLQLEWQVTPPLLKMLAIAHREFSAWVTQIDKKAKYRRNVSDLLIEAKRLRDSGDPSIASVLPATPSFKPEIAPEVAVEPAANVPEVELSEIEVPEVEVSEIEVPETEVEVSEVEIPEIEVPEIEAEAEAEVSAVEVLEIEAPETEASDFSSTQVMPEGAANEFFDDEIVVLIDESEALDEEKLTAPTPFEPTKSTGLGRLKRPVVPKFEPFDFSPFTFEFEEEDSSSTESGGFDLDSFEGETFGSEASESDPIPLGEEYESFETELTSTSDPDTLRISGIEISRALFELYVAEAQMHINTLHQEFNHLEDNPTLLLPESSLRAAHSCAGISGTAHCTSLYTLGKALELAQQRILDLKRPPTVNELALFKTCTDTLDAMLTKVIGLSMPLETPELVEQLDGVGHDLLITATQKSDDRAIAEAVARVFPEAAAAIAHEIEIEIPPRHPLPTESLLPVTHDEIDEQLFPIFIEEAREIINTLHTITRAWSGDFNNTKHPTLVKRQLHTLKGSARMAGAMILGNRVHLLETRVESALGAGEDIPTLVDEITSAVDTIEHAVAALEQGPASGAPVAEAMLEPVVQPAVADSTPQHGEFDKTTDSPTPAAPKPFPARRASDAAVAAHASTESDATNVVLRVRADTVDSFVNDASEIGVARTRIEGELRQLRRNLLDLTENVIRLRNQLREIEIQADVQVQTRIAQAESSQIEFDPLEMDRYTRLQEVTRMMAESVNDVTTVQQSLLKNLDSADFALHSQARTTRELQQTLMRVRMIPFDSLAVRLYRIVRRSAKELGKRANLEIRGGGIEIDRSVLEHIVAPLEHLLRNSLAHGIEPPEIRRAKDKPEIGQITLTTRQEGNEIVIELADDGAGLNFEGITTRARERGLLGPDEIADERRLANLIFLPGFTTAEKVTAVSGRGVGMDVVKAETAAVGGRVDVSSTPGEGTVFSIYLPLTLAVTQALLVRSGNQHYAIPASMISQIMELKVDGIERLRAEGSIEWFDKRYDYRYLANLLGNPGARPEIGRYSWVLLLHSGAQTLALHVDALRGHQEIIVKNAGPQLTRIAGMSGATVLGDGEIVLIINPVAMANREIIYRRAPQQSLLPAEAAPDATEEAIPEPKQEPEVARIPTIMVVDDSLTVRKITSRLLEREGYRVITAKDGVDAIESLIDNVPDLILSDIEMPRMDGFDFVRNVRADTRLRDVPVIMITSRLADKHRKYAMEIGANHYLGKPYQEEELLDLIANYASPPVTL